MDNCIIHDSFNSLVQLNVATHFTACTVLTIQPLIKDSLNNLKHAKSDC